MRLLPMRLVVYGTIVYYPSAKGNRWEKLVGGEMSEKVGFVGLGIMGKPMARNLMQAGYELVVHNRTMEKAEKLASEGATAAGSPTASVINIDPVVSGKHVGIRSSLQEQTRSASTRRRSMPARPTG